MCVLMLMDAYSARGGRGIVLYFTRDTRAQVKRAPTSACTHQARTTFGMFVYDNLKQLDTDGWVLQVTTVQMVDRA